MDELQGLVGADERFHRFREVSGVPAIEAALVQLNEGLAARGAAQLAGGSRFPVPQSIHQCNASECVADLHPAGFMGLCVQGGRWCGELAST